MAQPEGRSSEAANKRGITASGSELFQLVVDYAKQETLGPVKGLARFVLLGVSGSIALSVGATVLLVALLRALQTETGSTFGGHLSWLPYVITAGAAMTLAALAGWRVTKGQATRTGQRQGSRAGS